MYATTERTLGQYGTVEEAYRAKPGKNYRKSTAPKRTQPTAISALGASPTRDQIAKRERIEREQAKRNAPKRAKGGSARWVEYIGRTYDDLYGIKVKVSGISADAYWLPFSQASALWYEVSGTNLQDYVGE